VRHVGHLTRITNARNVNYIRPYRHYYYVGTYQWL